MSDQDQQGKIVCKIDGALVHSIQHHIQQHHSAEWTVERYKEEFPDEPLLSQLIKDRIQSRLDEQKKASSVKDGMKPLYEVFDMNKDDAGVLQGDKSPIMIEVLEKEILDAEAKIHIHDFDPNYVFRASALKNVLLGIALNIPTYVWGMMGTGKSTLIEQVCARTGRPYTRLQHSRDTEQSHIVGQTLVKDGATYFELGPLAYAMKHGLVYIADEYDFAMPAVLSLYQAVLEGGDLFIKEADIENRVIKPHPNFRFFATGNTNGSGDDTGLYQGTLIQNAANYERFGIVFEMEYMPKEMEREVVIAKSGIDKTSADLLVKFANLTREACRNGDITLPMSPRSIINSARVGVPYGDFKKGVSLAYLARLDSGSKTAADEIANRVFG
mgnify:CR=1 FL=1